jgi:hypothetical protein
MSAYNIVTFIFGHDSLPFSNLIRYFITYAVEMACFKLRKKQLSLSEKGGSKYENGVLRVPSTTIESCTGKKKQSHYRPGVAQRSQEVNILNA